MTMTKDELKKFQNPLNLTPPKGMAVCSECRGKGMKRYPFNGEMEYDHCRTCDGKRFEVWPPIGEGPD